MELIESIHNPKVSLWYQLKNKKGRDNQGLYIIEGIKLIEEAIVSNQDINLIILNKEINIPVSIAELLLKKDIKIITVSNAVFTKLSDTETPQGILAIIRKKFYKFNQLIDDNNNFILLIDGIQDPGNLGTIIRSADAGGISGIILGNNTVELYNPKVIRAAMGSIFHLPILISDLDDSIKKLKELKIRILGTSPYAKQEYYNVDLVNNIAILIGNEAKGLSEIRQKDTDCMIKIPIMGKAESLNVAMATTIVIYEHVRQKIG